MPRAPVTLETTRLVLTQPLPEDAERVVAYYEENREHLEPWEPGRPAEFYTRAYWAGRLRRSLQDLADDRAARLFIVLPGPGEVIGSVNLTEIVRGPLLACKLGFGLDHRHEGKGLMREALEAALDFAWDDLGLHRVEAAYQPHNQRSGGLLRRLGFVVEGYARDYLHLAGAWRDHVLTSKTNPRW
ncbi:MAG: GNAT family N-acetyltransferase [Planctomycetes bacterium]|nr:GNAT family N-acetyltransferase [Planctomycetota bacterium]